MDNTTKKKKKKQIANPKLTQRKQAENIIPKLHNNNRSEIKQPSLK